MPSDIIIKISNCNNIDNGTISITKNNLNIKYAMNGTGKSTVSNAIKAYLESDGSLEQLTPFKWQGQNNPEHSPKIEGLSEIKSVRIFNEDYIAQFAFQKEEVHADSFNIFVRTPDYDAHMNKIDSLISDVKNTFSNLKDLEKAIEDLTILNSSFGKHTKSGKISASSPWAKGLGKGNKITNIPAGLESYTDYLKSSDNYKWLKWHNDGHSFSALSENCPFCSSGTRDKKKTIEKIAEEFDSKSVEHLNGIMTVLDSLSKYFSPNAKKKLVEITTGSTGLTPEAETYLKYINEQINILLNRLLNLRGMNYFSMKDVDKVAQYIDGLKIDFKMLETLHSDDTEQLVNSLNNALDKVLEQVGLLQGEVVNQNALVARTITENKEAINNFLRSAGYKYHVDVEYAQDTYKMQLHHIDADAIVQHGTKYLSYGEKNALAIVLFMYACLAKNPDLIILDDPISSFDRNKKYAVMDMLFRRQRTLQGKTVLMLTHDLEPIIDVYTLAEKFTPIPVAAYLASKKGVLTETAIDRTDLKTFGAICDENIKRPCDDIVKITYLRRYYEIVSDDLPYQLLSNLLHRRSIPLLYGDTTREMTREEQAKAIETIHKKLPTFDYSTILAKLNNESLILSLYKTVSCNYEKLQIFRVLNHGTAGTPNPVIAKFINETFHIENEYIMQINPCKYEVVPDFIIEECDEILGLPPTA